MRSGWSGRVTTDHEISGVAHTHSTVGGLCGCMGQEWSPWAANLTSLTSTCARCIKPDWIS